MKVLKVISKILLIIGGLNWGIIGLFGINIVAMFLGGEMSMLTRVVYVLVGLAAIHCLVCLFRCCGKCHTE